MYVLDSEAVIRSELRASHSPIVFPSKNHHRNLFTHAVLDSLRGGAHHRVIVRR